MNPRKPLTCWQLFAQGPGRAESGFASTQFSLHHGQVGGTRPCVSAPHCDPFPKTWPSPIGVGPLFSPLARQGRDARTLADWVGSGPAGHGDFAFASGDDPLEFWAITTVIRGKHICGNSSLSFSSLSRWRAACKTRARARPRVPSQVPSSLTPPMATSSMAQSSAGLRALRPAPFRAPSAADTHSLTASAAGQTTTPATRGVTPPGWSFLFSPARAALT